MLSKMIYFEEKSFLINDKCISDLYMDSFKMILSVIFFMVFSCAVLNSDSQTMYLNNIGISKTYIFSWLLAFYMSIYSIHRLFCVRFKRTVIGLAKRDNYVYLKLVFKTKKLKKIQIITKNDDLNYKNKSEFGGKPYKKFSFEYIGVLNEDVIYLIPYADGQKESLINFLS